MFDFQEGGCKTMSQLYNHLHFSEEHNDTYPNYMCEEDTTCIVLLTGPNWETSAMVGTLINLYISQQVRFCVVGLQKNLSLLSQFLEAKNIVRRIIASCFVKQCRDLLGIHFLF